MVRVALISLIVGSVATLGVTSTLKAEVTDNTFRFYEHSGTLNDKQRMRSPQIGAAHAISLSSDLATKFSEEERAQIRTLGPWLTEYWTIT